MITWFKISDKMPNIGDEIILYGDNVNVSVGKIFAFCFVDKLAKAQLSRFYSGCYWAHTKDFSFPGDKP